MYTPKSTGFISKCIFLTAFLSTVNCNLLYTVKKIYNMVKKKIKHFFKLTKYYKL